MTKLSKHKLRLVALTIGFIATVILYYINYLVPTWGYQGFNEFDIGKSLVSLTMSIVYTLLFPLVYPSEIKYYSRFVVWILFYFLYLPSLIIVSMSAIPADGGFALVSCLTISFWLIAVIPELTKFRLPNAYRFPAHQKSLLHSDLNNNVRYKSPYDTHVVVVSSAFIFSVFIYNYEILGFFNISDIYLQREIASDFTANRTIFAYAEQWTNRLISPFLLAIGLIYRNRAATIVALLGFFLTFLISGSKYSLFSPLLMVFIYRYVVARGEFSGLQIGVFFGAALAIPFFVVQYYGQDVTSFSGLVLSQILKRAFASGGMTLGNYYDFFATSPYTYYSHIGPVRWIAEYPYGNYSIGQVVGHFQAGTYSYNMSANFWATDGIAAAGYIGILIIGGVLGSILAVFNQFVKPKHLVLVCLSSVGCIQMLADTSVFRVLLSGGWPLHFLLVYLYSRRLYPVGSRPRVSRYIISDSRR